MDTSILMSMGIYVLGLLSGFLPSYISRKGANSADKEDIAKITDKVEQVKSLYAVLLEEVKGGHQLKMAALDKRLQIHQEAFCHWSALVKGSFDEFDQSHKNASKWWDDNCLYLDATVRQEFLNFINFANIHHKVISSGEANAVGNYWAECERFPRTLFSAIQLPPLTAVELKLVMDQTSLQADRITS